MPKIDKIMFIIPPYMESVKTLGGSPTSDHVVFPPLQFGILGTTLKNIGYQIKVLAAPFSPWEDIKRALDAFRPDMVGFSCYSYTYKSCVDGAHLVKYLLPEAVVVFGGHHICEYNDIDILKLHPVVDFLVIGEGEITIVEALERLNQDRDLSGVRGTTCRIEGKLIRNPRREFQKNLKNAPQIDYALLDLTKLPRYYDRPPSEYTYFGKRFGIPAYTRMFPLVISRGCVGKCKFCSAPRAYHSFRTRDPEQVLEEIDILYREYGIDYFHISSPTFPQAPAKDKKLLQGILDKKLPIHWSSQTRGDKLDAELITLMKKTGCININFGVETGSSSLTHLLGKNRDNEKLKQTMIACAREGIPVAASFLHHYPQSLRGDYLQTLRFIWDVTGKGCLCHGHRMWIEINTDIYDLALEDRVLLNHQYWETGLLRSPRYHPPELEELNSFVYFILFMRIAFHIRQFGNFFQKVPHVIFEPRDPWRCRFFIELLQIGYRSEHLSVFTSPSVIRQLRETLSPEEWEKISFRPSEEYFQLSERNHFLISDAEMLPFIRETLPGRLPPAVLALKSADYPRGGLSPDGASIEKGVWDYETDDLIDIQIWAPGPIQATLKPKCIGLIVNRKSGLPTMLQNVQVAFPESRIRLIAPLPYLANVTQEIGLRSAVDYVYPGQEFHLDAVPEVDGKHLRSLCYDLLIVLTDRTRHRDHRNLFAVGQSFWPDTPMLGLCLDDWFLIGWPLIDPTWFYYRLRE